MAAQVIVLAGPSGVGKSHLVARLGLPVLRLDDFYKDGDDPTLPRLDLAGGHAIVDWDHVDSWHSTEALRVIAQLCAEGKAEAPVYEIGANATTSTHVVELADSPVFIAEGIFAQEIVPQLRELGLLADAICLTQRPALTFVRRFARDLNERRKPPFVLLRRGLHLLKAQSEVVAHAVALGCRPLSPEQALTAIQARVR